MLHWKFFNMWELWWPIRQTVWKCIFSKSQQKFYLWNFSSYLTEIIFKINIFLLLIYVFLLSSSFINKFNKHNYLEYCFFFVWLL